ncbi:MAG: hypothetical protein MJ252_08025 [archaeon]|nr:hypothetical protein [archaeon]
MEDNQENLQAGQEQAVEEEKREPSGEPETPAPSDQPNPQPSNEEPKQEVKYEDFGDSDQPGPILGGADEAPVKPPENEDLPSGFAVPKSRNSNASQIFALIVTFIMVLGGFVLNLLCVFIIKVKSDYVEVLGKNNNYSPLYIEGLTAISSEEKCPKGFEELPFGKWNGIIEGCKTASGVVKGKCQGEGTPIQETNAADVTILGGKKLCLSRLKTYKSLDVAKSCGSKKDCGVVDTVGNHLCIVNDGSYECPVNFMKISNTKPNACKIFDCKEIELSNEYKIYLSNENDVTGTVISQFILSDDIPCAKPGIVVSHSEYPLEKDVVSNTGDCPKVSSKDYTGDQRIIAEQYLIGEFPRTLIFSNNIPIPEGYPGDKTIKMYMVPYYGYDKTKTIYKRQVLDKSGLDEYNRNSKTYKKYAIVAFVFNCIALPYALIMPIYRKCKGTEEEDKGCLDFIMSLCNLLLVIFIIVSFVYCCYAKQSTEGYEEFTKNMLMIDFKDFNLYWLLMLILLILSTIGLALSLIIALCSCCLVCCGCCCFCCCEGLAS